MNPKKELLWSLWVKGSQAITSTKGSRNGVLWTPPYRRPFSKHSHYPEGPYTLLLWN